jgi:hypothetical protein
VCLGLGELYLYWREIEINQRLDAKDACFIGLVYSERPRILHFIVLYIKAGSFEILAEW